MVHGVSDIQGKERKYFLVRRGLVSCVFCRYHRNENYGRRAKEDRHKNHGKITIRRWDYETPKPNVADLVG